MATNKKGSSLPNTRSVNNKTGSKPKKKKKNIFLRLLLTLFLMGCIGLLSGAALFMHYVRQAPELSYEKLEDDLSSEIFASNGEMIYSVGNKKREAIKSEEIPFVLKEAIISIEDKRFEKHIGVDPIRIVGAVVANFKNSGSGGLQGGSTLTQQLIKLSFFSTSKADQTLERKAQEAWLSLELERQKSKDEILTYYINKVYMANGLYGMKTAAKTYYDKELDELTLAQSALFAGIPQAPNDYDPYVNPELAKQRRDMVLEQLRSDDKITEQEFQEALNEPIDHELLPVEDNRGQNKVIDNYIKEVLEEVETKTDKNIFTDGLKIYTNIDMDAQNYLYNLVNTNNTILFPNDEFQTAVTVMDVNTGKVVAQIGGRKIPDDVQLGENFATTAKRDFASAVKPINVYAPAIEYLNYSTAKPILDAPYKYEGTNTPLYNYDMSYRGMLTLREALVDSRNIPAAKTIWEVGLDKSQEFLNKLHVKYAGENVQSRAIHGETNSLEMAGAYGALANGGKYYAPSYIERIQFTDGTEEVYTDSGTRVMKESTAYMVTDILKDVLRRGTGVPANIANIVHAGKTGTSNYDDSEKDRIIGDPSGAPNISFVGYTPNYVIAIWTGYSEYFRSIPYSEQQLAMAIYKFMMSYMMNGVEIKDWVMPDSVVRIGNELFVKGYESDQYRIRESSAPEETVETSETTETSESSSSAPPAKPVESTPAPEPEPETSEPTPEPEPTPGVETKP